MAKAVAFAASDNFVQSEADEWPESMTPDRMRTRPTVLALTWIWSVRWHLNSRNLLAARLSMYSSNALKTTLSDRVRLNLNLDCLKLVLRACIVASMLAKSAAATFGSADFVLDRNTRPYLFEIDTAFAALAVRLVALEGFVFSRYHLKSLYENRTKTFLN